MLERLRGPRMNDRQEIKKRLGILCDAILFLGEVIGLLIACVRRIWEGLLLGYFRWGIHAG